MRRAPDFAPWGQSLSSLFPMVSHLLTLLEVRPPLDSRPRWFKPPLFRMFHRSVGQSTNRCFTLQSRVQGLIDAGAIAILPKLSLLLVEPSLFASPLKPPLDTPPVEPMHHFAPARQVLQPRRRRGHRAASDYAPLVAPLGILFPKIAPFLSLPEVRLPPDPLPRWYDAGLYCA